MEPSRFPVNPSMLPSFCKAQNGVTLLAKSADVLEQAKDTCSITRQLRFSRKGCPGSVSIFLIEISACAQWLSTCRARSCACTSQKQLLSN